MPSDNEGEIGTPGASHLTLTYAGLIIHKILWKFGYGTEFYKCYLPGKSLLQYVFFFQLSIDIHCSCHHSRMADNIVFRLGGIIVRSVVKSGSVFAGFCWLIWRKTLNQYAFQMTKNARIKLKTGYERSRKTNQVCKNVSNRQRSSHCHNYGLSFFIDGNEEGGLQEVVVERCVHNIVIIQKVQCRTNCSIIAITAIVLFNEINHP